MRNMKQISVTLVALVLSGCSTLTERQKWIIAVGAGLAVGAYAAATYDHCDWSRYRCHDHNHWK